MKKPFDDSQYKEYFKALEAYHSNNRIYFERYRKSPKLSVNEKKLLDVRSKLSVGKWEKALTILESISRESREYINADKSIMKSYVSAHLGYRKKAIKFSLEAFSLFLKINHEKGIIYSSYNLSVYYFEENNMKDSLKYIKYALKHCNKNYVMADIYRHLAFIYLRSGKEKMAKRSIENAKKLHSYLNQFEQGTQNVSFSDYYFRCGELKKMKKCLHEVKKSKNNQHKDWCYFLINFLDVFENGKKLGKAPKALIHSEKFNLKWLVVQLLQSGDYELARQSWEKLCALTPEVYLPNFKVTSKWNEESLFYKCVEKYLINNEVLPEKELSIKKNTKVSVLYELLANSNSPLRKEELIMEVWGEYDYDKHNGRFYQLVRTLRKKHKINVVNKHNAYYLAS